MTIDELYGLVPETRREEAKAAIAEMSRGYVKIDGPDIARKVMAENEFLKSILESETSKRVANHDERFKAEKLPAMIEEEIRKRGPKPKDPEVAALSDELAKMKAEAEASKAAAIKAQQKARALSVLAAKKLPETFADDYIGMTDEETDAKLARLTGALEPWVKAQVDAGVLGRVGTQTTPPAGNAPAPQDLRAQLEKAMADGNADLALSLQSKLQALGRKL